MYFVEPSRAGSSGESAGEGGSVGDATGLAVAPVGSAVGVAGSVDGAAAVGTADEDADAGAVASSCIAPDEPAVVDEHPAITAAASASPTVSILMRVPIAIPRSLTTWMPFTHQNLGRTLARHGSAELKNS
jgi:hypothetical protein